MTRALLSVLVICAAAFAAPADPPPVTLSEPTFVAPMAGRSSSAARLQVLARLPMDYRFHRGHLSLDGRPLTRTPVVIRARWWAGKGVDLMATVDVSDLERGWHVLRADLTPTEKGERLIGNDAAARVDSVETRFFFNPRPHRIRVKLVDGEGRPRYGRVMVHSEDGDPIGMGDIGDEPADPTGRDRIRSLHAVPPEGLILMAESGRYLLTGSGGVRDGIETRVVEVADHTEVVLTVPRVIDTPGEVTADLHVHTARSSDAFISDTDRFESMVAADVDVGVVTDHNRIRDPRPALEMLGLEDAVELVSGVEFRIGPAGESIGHGNAFPLRPEVKAVQPGDRSPGEVFEAWRLHHRTHPIPGEDVPLLIQLNHPRGIQFWPDKAHRTDAHGLFEELQFQRDRSPEDQMDGRFLKHLKSKDKSVLSFDAIEVLNRFSIEGWREVRLDWFALLNRGYRITGTGNADSHSSQLEAIGFPVNLVRASARNHGEFVEAIRAGAVRVTTGPLVGLQVRCGDTVLSPSHTRAEVNGPCRAEVQVQAADWVPVEEVRLVVNGEVIQRARVGTLGANKRYDFALPGGQDMWVIAEAGWPLEREGRPEGTPYARVAPGHVPVGFTNPIWLGFGG